MREFMDILNEDVMDEKADKARVRKLLQQRKECIMWAGEAANKAAYALAENNEADHQTYMEKVVEMVQKAAGYIREAETISARYRQD